MNRNFKIISSNVGFNGGRFSDLYPIKAAYKVAEKLFLNNKLHKIDFCIQETTKNSKKKLYKYIAIKKKDKIKVKSNRKIRGGGVNDNLLYIDEKIINDIINTYDKYNIEEFSYLKNFVLENANYKMDSKYNKMISDIDTYIKEMELQINIKYIIENKKNNILLLYENDENDENVSDIISYSEKEKKILWNVKNIKTRTTIHYGKEVEYNYDFYDFNLSFNNKEIEVSFFKKGSDKNTNTKIPNIYFPFRKCSGLNENNNNYTKGTILLHRDAIYTHIYEKIFKYVDKIVKNKILLQLRIG